MPGPPSAWHNCHWALQWRLTRRSKSPESAAIEIIRRRLNIDRDQAATQIMYVPSQMPMPVIATAQLRSLAELWSSKRKNDGLPARADFTDDDLRPWFGNLLMVD